MAMDKQDVLDRLSEQGQKIRKRFAVRKLSVFGSVSRGDAEAGSDLDVLVEFEGRADFDRFMDLKFYLEDLLGERVDLVTLNAIKPHLRAEIEREAIRVS